jgi:hypothetical protein
VTDPLYIPDVNYSRAGINEATFTDALQSSLQIHVTNLRLMLYKPRLENGAESAFNWFLLASRFELR